MAETPTKKCPFCGEMIHAEAVKCRFCKEFLEDAHGMPISYHDRRIRRSQTEAEIPPPRKPAAGLPDGPDSVLLRTSPSLWGLASFYTGGIIMLALAVFLIQYPVGAFFLRLVDTVSESTAGQITRYSRYTGIALLLITIGNCVIRTAQLKSIHYEISPDRIEFARGIFSRRIDNLDMFRVVDLKLHRSLVDCLLGVGTVTLMTKDESDPVFEFEKVARPKALYDVIKRASLEADRKQGVIHVD